MNDLSAVLPPVQNKNHLRQHYLSVRKQTVALAAPLEPEDTVVQSMASTSPTKWHLAHTTWFFEQFVLAHDSGWAPSPKEWRYIFNSYYQSVGPMHTRADRGLLSRPTLAQVLAYRERVDEAVCRSLEQDPGPDLRARVTLGLHHEQQHQELLLTDIKHLFSLNPLRPAYRALLAPTPREAEPLQYIHHEGGLTEVGYSGSGFCFDNERPRHRELLHPHAIASRPVTNAEFRDFIDDGGYSTPALWLSEGWNTVQQQNWRHPLYWFDDLASEFTLGGRRAIDPGAPVCHLSFYEADAFARWAGARLPTEHEWENLAAQQDAVHGNFLESGALHPRAAPVGAKDTAAPEQLFGDVWEWTCSPYVGYPDFKPLPGALGEYNGKFMCGQWVLRGGSCATPASHFRVSYRNFFYPADRWQFMGLRLGRDA